MTLPTRTVVLDGHPRASSMSAAEMRDMQNSPFLSRTSMFLKKVTLFRTGRRKSEERRGPPTMMPRSARSMDMGMGNKAYGMSQPVLSVSADHQSMTDNEDHSDASGSPTQSRSRPTSTLPPSQSAPPLVPVQSRDHTSAHSPPPVGLPPVDLGSARITIDGLPRSPEAIEIIPAEGSSHAAAQPSNTGDDVPISSSVGSGMSDSTSSESFHSVAEHMHPLTGEPLLGPAATHTPTAAPAAVDAPKSPPMKFNPGTPALQNGAIETIPLSLRSQSLPSRNLVSPNATPALGNLASTPSTIHATPAISEQGTPRAIHPRLASLPPPMMARYAAQGSARLTPSIVQRPMPILNLPILPPPTPPAPPPTAAQMTSPMRLRSMPALPMRGPSDMDTHAADHENAGLDEMEDVMEDEEDEDESPGERASDEDAGSSPSAEGGSVEVPGMGRRLRSPLPPSLSRSPRVPADLPAVDTSPLGIGFRTPTPGGAAAEAQRGTVYFTPTDPVPPVDILRTPVAPFRKLAAPNVHPTDYFTSKLPETSSHQEAVRTPRPTDFHSDVVAPKTVPMPHASPRPGLYNQTSKSMVNLLMTSKPKDKDVQHSLSENRKSRAVPDYTTANTRDTPEETAGPSTATASAKASPLALRRQRSLPMYNPASEPPPYPAFMQHQSPVVQPREEEGKERLPGYTNAIYLAAVMPRKMEFNAPGVQSKDRKWKRALCILEGTMFRVYQIHNGVIEDWWERTVGVGDMTSIDPSAVGPSGAIRVSGVRAEERRQDPSKTETAQAEGTEGASTSAAPCAPPPSRSKLHSLLHPRSSRQDKNMPPCSASNSRMSLDTTRDEARSSTSSTPRRQSMDSARTTSPSTSTTALTGARRGSRQSSDDASVASSGGSSPGSAPPAISHFSMLSSSSHMPIPEPDAKDLIRRYTLQAAESGLASDYVKRKNVIRVRMEGEQFLLQARDVPAVIEWIEGIQAATNIALDLDERPMPKGPMFPRRRRRRARRTDATSGAQNNNGNNDSNNASGSTARPS